MLTTHTEDHPLVLSRDMCHLREMLKPGDNVAVGYSLAHAMLSPGEGSLPHMLRSSSEVYYILAGQGEMHIDDEVARVTPGQVVYIPPGAVQHICNVGDTDLIFLCIVEPAWRAEDEVVMEPS